MILRQGGKNLRGGGGGVIVCVTVCGCDSMCVRVTMLLCVYRVCECGSCVCVCVTE